MAFHVRDVVRGGKLTVPVVRAGDVGIAGKAHRDLIVRAVLVIPEHHARQTFAGSVRGQRLLLARFGEVLQDDVGAVVHAPDRVGHPREKVDAGWVVLPPGADIPQRIGLRKSFREVEAEAVDVILGEPVLIHPIQPLLRERALVVVIVKHVERVARLRIRPGVVRRGSPERALVIQSNERTLPRLVVVHHVQDDRDAALVGFVDKLLKVFFRPVILVGGEVRRRVVTPALVAVEFGDRHQLDRVDAHAVEVVERVAERRVIMGLDEVPHQKLVDHQFALLRTREGGEVERRLPRLQNRHELLRLPLRVRLQVGVGVCGDERIVRAEDLLRVGIGDPQLSVHQVLKPDLFAGRQAGQLQPEPVDVGRIPVDVHLVLGRHFPVREVPDHVHELLPGRAEHKRGATCVVGVVVDAVFQAGRDGGLLRGLGADGVKRVRRGGPARFGRDDFQVEPAGGVEHEVVLEDRRRGRARH